MKKKMLITAIVLAIAIIILAILLVNSYINKKGYYKKYIEYYDDGVTPMACLTFIDEHNYSLYDCDSEPTNYFFDSENECTYSYNGENLEFDCVYPTVHEQKIRVLEWTEKEFSFEYDGYVKIFKAE